eukprot:3036196-Prymnesium_polylepis.1
MGELHHPFDELNVVAPHLSAKHESCFWRLNALCRAHICAKQAATGVPEQQAPGSAGHDLPTKSSLHVCNSERTAPQRHST